MLINPSDIKDEVLQKIIRRLSMALADPDIQEQMESEEIFEEELFEYIRRKEILVEQKDKELDLRNKEIELRNKEIESSQKEIKSKDKLIEELQKLLAQKNNK